LNSKINLGGLTCGFYFSILAKGGNFAFWPSSWRQLPNQIMAQ